MKEKEDESRAAPTITAGTVKLLQLPAKVSRAETFPRQNSSLFVFSAGIHSPALYLWLAREGETPPPPHLKANRHIVYCGGGGGGECGGGDIKE